MKLTLWEQLRNAAFKNDLHIQGLQSMIKTQQGVIDELRKDKEFLKKQLETTQQVREVTPEAPLDMTPMTDGEHWKPLRDMPELPSQRRARLEAASKQRKKKLMQEEKERLEAQ